MRRLFLVVSLFVFQPVGAEQADFNSAQQAASAGNYRDVVRILTGVLEDPEILPEETVVALANRGIAYSLLKAYALARQDLEGALSINPEHPLSLNHLGLLLEQVNEDYLGAAQLYERAILQGFPPSQVNLAKLYWNGSGLRRNPNRAYQLYKAAAGAGYNMAFVPLGKIYASGEGAPQDTKKAFDLFVEASKNGVSEANYHMGFAYEKGRGVRQNLVLAKRNYQIAAIQGHGQAQNALGYLYRRGLGVDQDYVEAATWYQLAADQGVPGAMNRLAWLLAGCPEPEVCDGEKAEKFAKAAVEIGETAGRLDSLAAAYARLGKFDEASQTMKRVLELLPQDHKRRAQYERRRSQYQQGIVMQL